MNNFKSFSFKRVDATKGYIHAASEHMKKECEMQIQRVVSSSKSYYEPKIREFELETDALKAAILKKYVIYFY